MSEISTINVGNTEYTLKDTVARSQGGGGGSYVLQCVEYGEGTIRQEKSWSKSFSSDTGGVLYLTSSSISGISLTIDSISISQMDMYITFRNYDYNITTYMIPFRTTVSVDAYTYSSSSRGSTAYGLHKYVKLS